MVVEGGQEENSFSEQLHPCPSMYRTAFLHLATDVSRRCPSTQPHGLAKPSVAEELEESLLTFECCFQQLLSLRVKRLYFILFSACFPHDRLPPTAESGEWMCQWQPLGKEQTGFSWARCSPGHSANPS